MTNIYDLITCSKCGVVLDKHIHYEEYATGEKVITCPLCKNRIIL
jgi:DNA-directed RNA polymerase subunit RPC12/RpoP